MNLELDASKPISISFNGINLTFSVTPPSQSSSPTPTPTPVATSIPTPTPVPTPTFSTGLNAPFNGKKLVSPLTNDITTYPVATDDLGIRNFLGYYHIGFDPSMPYNIVDSSITGYTPVTVSSKTGYPDESDIVKVPFNPKTAFVEGTDDKGVIQPGDNHLIIYDRRTNWIYEMYRFLANADGTFQCDSMAIWNSERETHRPWKDTSADLAGLSILAGLLRYEEAANDTIDHAVRMTIKFVKNNVINLPASHTSGNLSSNCPPAGVFFKLRPDFDYSKFTPMYQNITKALMKYGAVVADLGSAVYLSTDTDPRWNANGEFAQWSAAITLADFIEVSNSQSYTDVPPGELLPIINTFTGTKVSDGVSLTYQGNIGTYGYSYIENELPFEDSTVVVPVRTDNTYTLVAANRAGRVRQTITVA